MFGINHIMDLGGDNGFSTFHLKMKSETTVIIQRLDGVGESRANARLSERQGVGARWGPQHPVAMRKRATDGPFSHHVPSLCISQYEKCTG